jgi:hypothetical protein
MAPSAISVEAAPVQQSKQLVPRSEDQKEKTPLQAISQGVCLPGLPLFSEYDKHRAWMLSHMAGAFRVFARKGYTGSNGMYTSPEIPINFVQRGHVRTHQVSLRVQFGNATTHDFAPAFATQRTRTPSGRIRSENTSPRSKPPTWSLSTTTERSLVGIHRGPPTPLASSYTPQYTRQGLT